MGQRQWGLQPEALPCAYTDFAPLPRPFKGSFGPARLVKHRRTGALGVEKAFAQESDEHFRALTAALKQLAAAPDAPYLRPLAADLRDGGFCGISSLQIVFEHFDYTLEDAAGQRKSLFEHESRVWALLLDVVEALAHERVHRSQNAFLHPRSIVFASERGCWLLVHHRFFPETTFSLAFSDLQAQFCSPELYAQTLDRHMRFYLSDFDASNVFSLAVVLAWLLLGDKRAQLRGLYSRESATVDVGQLRALLGGLAEAGFSPLLLRVLHDMTEELGYRRVSSARLAKLLGASRPLLTHEGFAGHAGLLARYAQEKDAQDEQSMHEKLEAAYAGDYDETQHAAPHAISDAQLGELMAHTAPFRTYEEIFF